jgi:uncharacterized protein
LKFHLNLGDQRFLVQNYGDAHVTINNERYDHSLILTPERRIDWPVSHAGMLNDDLLAHLLSDDPEVIVIGTGLEQVTPNIVVMRFFAQHGLGLEFVSTPTACRIYNILASEGRRVSCGLIITPGMQHD